MKKPNMMEARRRTKEKTKIITDAYFIPKEIKNCGRGLKYYLRTYGCQMNLRDSESISAILEDLGYIKTLNDQEADLIILNTCAVRENVHNKVFGLLGLYKHYKKKKPNLLLGLCGCMAQEEVVINKIIKEIKHLDFVFGTHNIHLLPSILKEYQEKKKMIVNVLSNEGNIYENIPLKREHPYKAFVNITYGCDKFCTYCIVPYTRGKERSRQPEDIFKEVKGLLKKGYLEITLLGQNVNAYGKDFLDKKYRLENLLEDLAKTGIKRLRFLTSHPWDFTEEMIDVIEKYDNIMPHIHLPVQSGSNKILKLMGRRYSKEEYLTLYKKIKDKITKVAITTDIIVGFPYEDEKDFEETLSLVKECQFDGAFIFIYSPREGTPAFNMEDKVSLTVKKERFYKLHQLTNQYTKESNLKLQNKIVSVLIEGYSNNKELLTGYTDTFKVINVKGSSSLIGQIVKVKVTKVRTWSLYGEVVN
ncbi:MAG: tRNA (N6-isopentenyl adenosine(37)-C2)-methylthiotransferase MiaB [Bacilli bacterium]|jgi:tRNA-2-methylthio-N6-dimethylallyladenosine synthase